MSNETELVPANAVPDDDDISYAYDEESARHADDVASRITENGAFVGMFVKAEATKAKSGTHGIVLGFEAPGQGTAEFTLYTKKEDGTETFGMAQVNAILFLLGLKGLKSAPAKVEAWVDKADGSGRTKEEVMGRVFPELLKKPIGIVLQKELFTKQGGGTGERMNLYGLFQPETKLMMSEIKDRKSTPVKLERLLKGLKTKDGRKAVPDEPAQPTMGGVDGY